ncbi:MAG: hypothetical protein BGO83_12160 [Devosia sp. 66-14]|nr:MAG: hypothetical protein ABS47_09075 [Devosia sp. SCN 66-27]OJX25576.1 MAG: hypothetical protein BGO83_12160 [Devosia sp. 66-14]
MMVEPIMHRLAERHMEMCALRDDMQKKCADVVWVHEVMHVGGAAVGDGHRRCGAASLPLEGRD